MNAMNFGLVTAAVVGVTAYTFLEFNGLLRLPKLRAQLAGASLGDDELDGLIYGELFPGEGLIVRDALRSQALAEYWRRWEMCGLDERDLARGLVQDLVRSFAAIAR
jgi:hypothetical protein